MACTHEEKTARICVHLDADEDLDAEAIHYPGVGLDEAVLCKACATGEASVVAVCAECGDRATYVEKVIGRPQVLARDAGLGFARRDLGVACRPADAAPLPGGDWLLLVDDELRWLSGDLFRLPARFDALHVSADGGFAAAVERRGRSGVVVDLASGRVTMRLDRGSYHIDRYDFAATFFVDGGRTRLVHAVDWNRLDIADPAGGEQVRALPETHRFHSSLAVSPDQRWLVDGGFVWHPAGILAVCGLPDGLATTALRQTNYAWSLPHAFVDAGTLVVWGHGPDDLAMVDAAELYDLATGRRLRWFAGVPHKPFFVDDGLLLAGGTVWDLATGELLLDDPGVDPIGFHTGTRELLAVEDGELVAYRLLRPC
jgi:hypothetical protein